MIGSDVLIDIHSHVFNGRDMPLREFLHYGQGVPDPVAYLIQLLVQGDSDDMDSAVARTKAAVQAKESDFPENRSGLLAYAQLLRLPDAGIAQRLVDTYPQVDLFTPAITDMDCWLGGTHATYYPDRVATHADIASTLAFAGKMHPMIGFDPVRQVATGGDHLRLVQDAIGSQGFVGVKVYPPMGYRPIGNAALYPGKVTGPDGQAVRCVLASGGPPVSQNITGAQLDTAMLELFRYCITSDVPVMVHCTPEGAQSGPGRGLNSDPYHWRNLLSKQDDPGYDYSTLRLNLAHFGSDTGRPDFVHEVGALMRDFPNVYADVGAHDLVNDSPGEGSQRTFAYELRRLIDNHCDWTSRIMLGTDWHTILRYPDPQMYIQRYLSFFEREFVAPPQPPPYNRATLLADFIGRSSIRFLGLTQSDRGRGGNYDRLDQFYTNYLATHPNFQRPAWWDRIPA